MLDKNKIVSIKDFQTNDVLEGAISTEAIFSVLENNGKDISFAPIRDHVSKEYAEDVENKIFINLNGAVANAFDLKFFNDEERPKAIEHILTEYKDKYPDYEFEMKKGNFPVKVTSGFQITHNYKMNDYPTMSTHVLYITNYGRFIKKPRMLIKK